MLIGRDAKQIDYAIKIRKEFLAEVEEMLLEEAIEKGKSDAWYDDACACATELIESVQLASSWTSMRSRDAKRVMFPYHDMADMRRPIAEQPWQIAQELEAIEREKRDVILKERYSLPKENSRDRYACFVYKAWQEVELEKRERSLSEEHQALLDQIFSSTLYPELLKEQKELFKYEQIIADLLEKFSAYYRMRAKWFAYNEILKNFNNSNKKEQGFFQFAKNELEGLNESISWSDTQFRSSPVLYLKQVPNYNTYVEASTWSDPRDHDTERGHVGDGKAYYKDEVPRETGMHPRLVRFFFEEAENAVNGLYDEMKAHYFTLIS